MEVVALAFEAVELAIAHAPFEHFDGCVDQDDEVRPHRVQGPLVDLANLVERQASAVSLVGERRVHAAIADHVAAGSERRCDDLVDVLGTIGGNQQRLGPV